MMDQLYISYGPLVLGLIFSGLGLLGMTLLSEKIKSSKFGQIFIRAMQQIRASVIETNRVHVKYLKEGHADGKLTKEERAFAKRKAMESFKASFGEGGIKKLATVLGIDDVDGWIGSQIEDVVEGLKPSPKK